MRKFYILLTLVVSLLSGCVDGDDGDAYLAFYWVGLPMAYADNNPGVPGTIFLLENYLVSPGTYSFSYTAFEGSMYAGTYTITEEEGDPGIFPFIAGADGDDNYFELWLFSSGPSFFLTSTELEEIAAQNFGANTNNNAGLIKQNFVENIVDDLDETVLSQTKGRYTMTLRYRKQ